MSQRWVLDTNVIVSALLFGGRAGRLHLAWIDGTVLPVASRAMLAELQRVLVYPKFRLAPEQALALVDQELLPFLELLPDVEGERICADPDDDKFLHLARSAGITVLVSGDGDLLALRPEWHGVEILNLADALTRLEQGGDGEPESEVERG